MNDIQASLINYIQDGVGQPVILVHGIAASLNDWQLLLPDLSAAGYHAYAPDLLGHGDSHKPDDPAHYHAKTVYALFENWLAGLELDAPPILIGHSLGGYLSLRYSLRNPQKVRGLVLIDPFYSPLQLSPLLRMLHQKPQLGVHALKAAPTWLLHILVGRDPVQAATFTHQARQQIALDLKRASPHVLHIPRTIRDLTPRLADLDIPTLVIWGEKDLTLSPATFPRLVNCLPNATGRCLPGCGHQPHISKPKQVNRLILDFIQPLDILV